MTEHQPHEGEAIGLGITQEVNPGRQQGAQNRLDDLYRYHVQAGTHLWLVLLSHLASDGLLDHQDGRTATPALLDTESLVGAPAIACYVCEVAYDPRLRRRRCPGDPMGPRS